MYFERRYFVKITAWGGYKVNVRREKNKNYLTQSGTGICGFCKLNALLAIKFTDDLWLDKYGYALPDDQVMYYKMYLNGYRLVASSQNTLMHLDARAGHVSGSDYIKKVRKQTELTSRNFTIFWYKYVWSYRIGLSKYWSAFAFGVKVVVTCLANFVMSVLSRRWSCVLASLDGYRQAFVEIRNKTI